MKKEEGKRYLGCRDD